jgi:hypothetical protein
MVMNDGYTMIPGHIGILFPSGKCAFWGRFGLKSRFFALSLSPSLPLSLVFKVMGRHRGV